MPDATATADAPSYTDALSGVVPPPAAPQPSSASLQSNQADQIAGGAAANDAQNLPVTSNRPAPALPAPAPPQRPPDFLSRVLHAVGDVLGGPRTAQRVNPTTGAIESVP